MLRSRIVRRRLLVVLLLLGVGACKKSSRDATFDVTWQVVPEAGPCGSETQLDLRYVIAPNHFQTVCSTQLADLLKAGRKPTVPVVLQVTTRGTIFKSSTSTSLCGIAGVALRRLPRSGCTFEPMLKGSAPSAGYRCPGKCPDADRVEPWNR